MFQNNTLHFGENKLVHCWAVTSPPTFSPSRPVLTEKLYKLSPTFSVVSQTLILYPLCFIWNSQFIQRCRNKTNQPHVCSAVLKKKHTQVVPFPLWDAFFHFKFISAPICIHFLCDSVSLLFCRDVLWSFYSMSVVLLHHFLPAASIQTTNATEGNSSHP